MDWKKLIADLAASGMTQTEIGAAIGVSQGRIGQVIGGKGATFKYETGVRLVELHRQRCSELGRAEIE